MSKEYFHRAKLNSLPADAYVQIVRDTGKDVGDVPEYIKLALIWQVPEGTPVNAAAASGSVVFSGTPVADETLTIGDNVYTFKASRSGAYEITINADNTTQGDNLVTALTADDPSVVGVNTTGTVAITAATKGAAGNDIALATDATGTAVSGANLTGGVDGTVGLDNQLYVDSSYLYVCLGDNAITDTNWRRIALGTAY